MAPRFCMRYASSAATSASLIPGRRNGSRSLKARDATSHAFWMSSISRASFTTRVFTTASETSTNFMAFGARFWSRWNV